MSASMSRRLWSGVIAFVVALLCGAVFHTGRKIVDMEKRIDVLEAKGK